MDGKGLKILGIGLTIVAAIIGVASAVVSDKQRDQQIHDEVSNQLAGLLEKRNNV